MDYVKNFLRVEGTIGQGAFGRVLATSLQQNRALQQSNNHLSSPTSDKSNVRFALKCVHPILKPQRLASELRFLRDLGGQCNVVQMHTAHFYMGSLYIVMELIEHHRFVDFVADLEYHEIILYMKNLLIALQHVHGHNIMHRDIKPGNFLYNRLTGKFLLIDFGLAQVVRSRYTPSRNSISMQSPIRYPAAKRTLPASPSPINQMLKKLRVSNHEPVKLTVGAYESPITNNDHKFSKPHRRSSKDKPEPNAPKSGTPGFKAPEVLLRYPYQTTAIDIWSAGVIMACLLCGHTPFFRDVDDNASLEEIIRIFGSQRMTQVTKALGIRITMEPKPEPIDLPSFCRILRCWNNTSKRNVDLPDSAFDLLQRMLDPNPLTRITASDALRHDWFSDAE